MTQTTEAPFKYIAKFEPVFAAQSNGKFTVANVPIFECHDSRGWKCDAAWMRKTVAQQYTDKNERGFLPRIIVGHTEDDADKRAQGSLDNFRYDENDEMLYADLIDIPAALKSEMENGEWPGRSVEAYSQQNRISALALLGGTKPAFILPDMKFNNQDDDSTELDYGDESPQFYHYQYKEPDDQEKLAGEAPQKFSEDQLDQIRELITEDHKYKEDNQMSEETNTNEDVNTGDDPGVSRQDYADQQAKIEVLQTANAEQAGKLLKLEQDAEKDKWVAKYKDKRIPENRLNIDTHTKFIMKLDAEDRQDYFDNTINLITPPSTQPTKVSEEGVDDSGAIDQGGLTKFYDEHKSEFKGDFAAASKAYAKQERAKGNPQYTRK